MKLVLPLALVALPLFLTACGDDPPEQPHRWVEAFDSAGGGSMSGVWGSGPDDVFVVGGDERSGAVFHFDGSAWSPMPLPADTPLLVWVSGFGPDDVWAVGIGGAVVRYDGSAWRRVDVGTDADLWGVYGAAPDDVWIVGGDARGGDPAMLHYDGQAFSAVSLDDVNPRDASSLFKVWGVEGRVWAVGQAGWVIERVEGAWQVVPAGGRADQDFVSLWGTSPDDVVIVGGRANARVATASDVGFETVAPSGFGGLNAVWVSAAGEVVVGGASGVVGTYERASGEILVEEAPLTVDAVHAVWGDGAGAVYAVGGSFMAPHRGMVWVRE